MEGDKRYYILITDTTFSEQILFSQLKWAMTTERKSVIPSLQWLKEIFKEESWSVSMIQTMYTITVIFKAMIMVSVY